MNVPETLNGPFTGLIVGTYTADPEFLERFLLPRLPRSITNRVILADARRLHAALSDARNLRRLNRTYVAAPIASAHAHHPKFLLLTGATAGRLLVGSGNATLTGYTAPGEMFTRYDWTAERTDDLAAFQGIRQFLDNLHEDHNIDDIVWRLIRDQLTAATWLTGTPVSTPVISNLRISHLDQLKSAVGRGPVEEVIAYAPFHDHSATALREVIRDLKPASLRLLVQQRSTALDVSATKRATRSLGAAFSVAEIQAPDRYDNAYLHAKFVLVRTRDRDVLLQGSANLSAVALCRSGDDANVELGNLLIGERGQFDSLLDGLTIDPLAGLHEAEPADFDDTDSDDLDLPNVGNVAWSRPTLTGRIDGKAAATAIEVWVAGRRLSPIESQAEVDGPVTAFTLRFDDNNADTIDAGTHIEIQVNGGEPLTVFPYRVPDLLRLSSAGHRIDLLQQAGHLDLDDKEIADLLQELDRILIVDGHSLWRLANPTTTPTDTDDAAASMAYDDIDWERLQDNAILKGYGSAYAPGREAPTELAILLDSLTSRFRAEARRGTADDSADEDDDPDDLGYEPEYEDEDDADDNADEGDDLPRRARSASERSRRMWRSFVKRYTHGITDHAFVDAVGPGIVVPSYIAFNHLCRRLRIRDLADPDFLTDSQVSLWRFMWGDGQHAGYLADLSPTERQAALKVFADHEDAAATLAAIEDTYWHVWERDADLHPLRDTVRAIVTNGSWKPSAADLRSAAAATSAVEIDDAQTLIDELRALAGYITERDLEGEVATALGLRPTDLRWTTEATRRGASTDQVIVLHLPDDHELPANQAATALATWARLEPDLGYYRVCAARRTAILDTATSMKILYDRDTDEEVPLSITENHATPWGSALDALEDLLSAA